MEEDGFCSSIDHQGGDIVAAGDSFEFRKV
jgi:hypothetical protein